MCAPIACSPHKIFRKQGLAPTGARVVHRFQLIAIKTVDEKDRWDHAYLWAGAINISIAFPYFVTILQLHVFFFLLNYSWESTLPFFQRREQHCHIKAYISLAANDLTSYIKIVCMKRIKRHLKISYNLYARIYVHR